MPGTLYIVATPIGNLEDITLRAVRILRGADLIAAEDTRHTALLLRHHHVETPLTSFHEHNERQKLPHLLERLRSGATVALVSDAGTPGVSDPGYRLVRACRDEGIKVSPLPGPSATLSALVASGLPTHAFTFVGYPPPKAVARQNWLKHLKNRTETLILFEAPHRIAATLADVIQILGNRQICVARELTKIHEQILVGRASEVLMRLQAPKGEITIVVEGAAEDDRTADVPPDAQIAAEVGHLTELTGVSRREAARMVGAKYGLPPNVVYAHAQRGRK